MGDWHDDLRVDSVRAAVHLRLRGVKSSEPWGWRLWSQTWANYEVISGIGLETWSDIQAIWLAPDGSLTTANFKGNYWSIRDQAPRPSTPESVSLATPHELELPDREFHYRDGPDFGADYSPGVLKEVRRWYPDNFTDAPGTFLRKALVSLCAAPDDFLANTDYVRDQADLRVSKAAKAEANARERANAQRAKWRPLILQTLLLAPLGLVAAFVGSTMTGGDDMFSIAWTLTHYYLWLVFLAAIAATCAAICQSPSEVVNGMNMGVGYGWLGGTVLTFFIGYWTQDYPTTWLVTAILLGVVGVLVSRKSRDG